MEENFDIEQAESVSNSEIGNDFEMKFVLSDKDVVDSIYQSLRNGESGQIASLQMKSPLQVVAILAHSNGGESFDLSAHILVNREDFVGEERGMNEIMRDIVLELSDGIDDEDGEEEEDIYYIVSTKSNGELLITAEDEGSVLSISMGGIAKYVGKEVKAEDSPKLTKENLQAYLTVILDVTGIAIQEFYKGSDTSRYSPVLEITKLIPVRQHNEHVIMAGDRKSLLKRIEVKKDRLNYALDDVGGQEQAKEIVELCLLGFNSPEVYKKWGIEPPRALLFHGPAGTGKTLMAKVLASSSDSRFFNVRSIDIVSGCFGDSERALKDVFNYARKGEGRTIVFFDKIDVLAPSVKDAYENAERVVGTLLFEMDELLDSPNVFVIGATDNLNGLDDVLKRESRFAHIVKLELPNAEERLEIFNIHINRAEDGAEGELFEDIDWGRIAGLIDGFSGADIAEVVRKTLERKVKEELYGGNPSLVSTEDLINTIQEYKNRDEKEGSFGFVVGN